MRVTSRNNWKGWRAAQTTSRSRWPTRTCCTTCGAISTWSGTGLRRGGPLWGDDVGRRLERPFDDPKESLPHACRIQRRDLRVVDISTDGDGDRHQRPAEDVAEDRDLPDDGVHSAERRNEHLQVLFPT